MRPKGKRPRPREFVSCDNFMYFINVGTQWGREMHYVYFGIDCYQYCTFHT